MMTYETRTKAVHALRTTTAKQIQHFMDDGKGGRCANGVLCEAFAMPMSMDLLQKALGVPVNGIFMRNDGTVNLGDRSERPPTFAEIADWLEQQPVIDPPQIPDFAPAEIEVAA